MHFTCRTSASTRSSLCSWCYSLRLTVRYTGNELNGDACQICMSSTGAGLRLAGKVWGLWFQTAGRGQPRYTHPVTSLHSTLAWRPMAWRPESIPKLALRRLHKWVHPRTGRRARRHVPYMAAGLAGMMNTAPVARGEGAAAMPTATLT
eukprot:345483-Chlamydomonas_euryale.AAC.7